MKRRFLAGILVSLTLASALTGCGGKEEEAAPAVTDVSETAGSEEESEEEPEEEPENETEEAELDLDEISIL